MQENQASLIEKIAFSCFVISLLLMILFILGLINDALILFIAIGIIFMFMLISVIISYFKTLKPARPKHELFSETEMDQLIDIQKLYKDKLKKLQKRRKNKK